MIRAIAIIAVAAIWVTDMAHSAPSPPGWEKIPAKPMAYKDPMTSITLYVESDGRHVAAIDEYGKLLWVRSPYEESGGEKIITTIGSLTKGPLITNYAKYFQHFGFKVKADDRLIDIYFTSNFFGEINERTGDFVLIGIG